MSAVSLLE